MDSRGRENFSAAKLFLRESSFQSLQLERQCQCIYIFVIIIFLLCTYFSLQVKQIIEKRYETWESNN